MTNLDKAKQNAKVSIHEILQYYTNWLVKNGYTDTDTIYEEPLAVDEYLKENPAENILDTYAMEFLRGCLPKKADKSARKFCNKEFIAGYNACIDQILTNTDNKQ